MKKITDYIVKLFCIIKKVIKIKSNIPTYTDISIDDKIESLIINQLGIEKSEISDEKHIYNDLSGDELDIIELLSDIESYYNISIQEGAFKLTIGELKNYVKKIIKDPSFEVPENQILYEENGWFSYIKIKHSEDIYGRELAIRQLIDNEYQIFDNEYGNPHKEIINFTILFFVTRKFTDKEKFLNFIQRNFPIMNSYLIRQINLLNQNLQLPEDFKNDNILNFDEQKAYFEFINFVCKYFTTNFKEKTLREQAIRKNFKYQGNAIISYIESKFVH
jgi:acyl carrier protein